MLIPRRVKHRKQHHPDRHGASKGGNAVTFGQWGLQAMEPAAHSQRSLLKLEWVPVRVLLNGG